MIIYGYRNRNVTVGTGTFECPRCQMTRTYQHINVVRYFTLFFILQLFPLGRVGSFIECETCRTAFKPEELIGTRGNELMSQDVQKQVASAKADTASGRGCALAVVGGILAAVGALLTVALTISQVTAEAGPTDNLVGFFCLGAIFLVPLALGMALILWGVRIRRKSAETISASATSMPMA
jgi:hypothetical protein